MTIEQLEAELRYLVDRSFRDWIVYLVFLLAMVGWAISSEKKEKLASLTGFLVTTAFLLASWMHLRDTLAYQRSHDLVYAEFVAHLRDIGTFPPKGVATTGVLSVNGEDKMETVTTEYRDAITVGLNPWAEPLRHFKIYAAHAIGAALFLGVFWYSRVANTKDRFEKSYLGRFFRSSPGRLNLTTMRVPFRAGEAATGCTERCPECGAVVARV